MTIVITFLEDFFHPPFEFAGGETIEVVFLGGGDLMRLEYQGKRLEIPNSAVRIQVK